MVPRRGLCPPCYVIKLRVRNNVTLDEFPTSYSRIPDRGDLALYSAEPWVTSAATDEVRGGKLNINGAHGWGELATGNRRPEFGWASLAQLSSAQLSSAGCLRKARTQGDRWRAV
jgi:hypothetical protein